MTKPVHEPSEMGLAFAQVAGQIELAMRESDGQVEKLGAAIERLAAVLEEMPAGLNDSDPANWLVRRVQVEVSACVECLQFYDHMVQHLSHVRDFAAATGALAGAGTEYQVQVKPLPVIGGKAWEDVRRRLRGRLISDDQRDLFDLLVAPETRSPPPLANLGGLHSGEGGIEIF